MIRHRISLAAVSLAVLFFARPSLAAVLYSNLGPGDTYVQSSGLSVDVSHNVAAPFQPTATASLGALEMALQYNVTEPTPQNLFHISLAADSGGSPGGVIEDLGVVVSPTASGSTNNALVTALSVSHPLLTAGTQYWIEATNLPPGSNPGTDGRWDFNTTGDSSHVDSRFNGGAWQWPGTINVAFRVDSAVPEPSGLFLAGCGLALLVAAGRWFRP